MSKFIFPQKTEYVDREKQNKSTDAKNQLLHNVGVIANNSNINFYNTSALTDTPIASIDNNRITIDDKSNFADKNTVQFESITSNKNNRIFNKSNLQTNPNRQVYSNSLYNFPTPLCQLNNYKNSTLLSVYPYISRPIINDGSKMYFGQFSDSILIDDLICYATGNQITSVNNTTYSCGLKYLTDNLPYNLNGHNITLKIYNCSVQQSIYFKNITGGTINLEFSGSSNTIFQFYNCKNINITGSGSIKALIVKDCKNFNVNGITITGNNTTYQTLEAYGFSAKKLASIQFTESKVFLKNVKFKLSSQNDNIVGFSASNSKIYMQGCTFQNYFKACQMYGDSTVDTGDEAQTLSDYQNQSSGAVYQYNYYNDGLYKHLHTSYIPMSPSLPMGSIIGYPRIINGNQYLNKKIQYNNYPDSILYTLSMNNQLPGCLIPLDCDNTYKSIWSSTYADKLNIFLQNTLYSSNQASINNIYTLDTTSSQQNYFLFTGLAYKGNTKTSFNPCIASNSYLNNLSSIISSNITLAHSFSSKGNGATYEIGKQGTGISCKSFNSQENNGFIMSAQISLSSIMDQLFGAQSYAPDSIRNYIKNIVYPNSYVEFKIDDNTINLSLEYISSGSLFSTYIDKNNVTQLSSCIPLQYLCQIPPSSKWTDSELGKSKYLLKQNDKKIKFNKLLSQFKVYYYGIPTQNFNTFYGQDICSDNISVNGDEQTIYDTDTHDLSTLSIKTILRMPENAAYYTWRADTVLCLYLSNVNPSIDLNKQDQKKKDKINKYTQKVFRQALASYTGSKTFIYLSSTITSESQFKNVSAYLGSYQLDSQLTNTWIKTQYGQNIQLEKAKLPRIVFSSGNWKGYKSETDSSTFMTITNNLPSGQSSNGYLLYSKSYGSLEKLSNKFPKIAMDIQNEYQKNHVKYLQAYELAGKTFGFIPASGYNFDFSRTSINSNVSGYFRITDYNKRYIYYDTDNVGSRILTGRVNGFQEQLHRIYLAQYNMGLYLSEPYFRYECNNQNYQLYPFQTESVLSTTSYTLCSGLVMTNAFVYTMNRLADVLTYNHGTIITDTITNTKYDIQLSSMYPNYLVSSQYINTYGMVYPMSEQNVLNSSIIATNIPYIQQDILTGDTNPILYTPMFKIGTSNVKAYGFGAISQINPENYYINILNKNESSPLTGTLLYQQLPKIYNVNNCSGSKVQYDAFIELPQNYSNLKYKINTGIYTTLNIDNFRDIIPNKLDTGRNKLYLSYTINGQTKQDLYIINGQPTFGKVSYNKLVLPKRIKHYIYRQEITINDLALFKKQYNLPIQYMAKKAHDIWSIILKHCDNDASFMSYSTLVNNDPFIFGMQLSSATTMEKMDMTDIKVDKLNFKELFSIYGTVKYFDHLQANYNTCPEIFDNNYLLTSFIKQSE